MFIVRQPLETLISGNTAEELDIISFHAINMTQSNSDKGHQETTDTLPETNDTKINAIVRKYSKIFYGIGKCKNRKITLHTKTNAKPCIQPIRPISFHLRKQFDLYHFTYGNNLMILSMTLLNKEYVKNTLVRPNGYQIRL